MTGSLTSKICVACECVALEAFKGKGYCPNKADLLALGTVLSTMPSGVFEWKSVTEADSGREILKGEINTGNYQLMFIRSLKESIRHPRIVNYT